MRENTVEIGHSRTKVWILICLSVVLSAVCFWLFFAAETQSRFQPFAVKIISVMGMLFFGLAGLFGFYRLYDKSPAVILNNEGIAIATDFFGKHFIVWSEIEKMEIGQLKGRRFLLIFVFNPEAHLQKAKSAARFWMKVTERMYGTPFTVPSGTLNMKFAEFIGHVNEYNDRLTGIKKDD